MHGTHLYITERSMSTFHWGHAKPDLLTLDPYIK